MASGIGLPDEGKRRADSTSETMRRRTVFGGNNRAIGASVSFLAGCGPAHTEHSNQHADYF